MALRPVLLLVLARPPLRPALHSEDLQAGCCVCGGHQMALRPVLLLLLMALRPVLLLVLMALRAQPSPPPPPSPLLLLMAVRPVLLLVG